MLCKDSHHILTLQLIVVRILGQSDVVDLPADGGFGHALGMATHLDVHHGGFNLGVG